MLDPPKKTKTAFQFATETSIVCLHMAIPNYFFKIHIILFTSVILYAFLKHFSILILLLMMTICKSLVTRLFVLIIHLIPNVEVSVLTAKTIYLKEL